MIQRFFLRQSEPFTAELHLRLVNGKGETVRTRLIRLWHNPDQKSAFPWLVQVPCKLLRRTRGPFTIAPPCLVCEATIHTQDGQVIELGFMVILHWSHSPVDETGKVRMQAVLSILADQDGIEFARIERPRLRKKPSDNYTQIDSDAASNLGPWTIL